MKYTNAQDFATNENLRNTVEFLSSRLDSLSDNIKELKEDMNIRFSEVNKNADHISQYVRKDMDVGFSELKKEIQFSYEKTRLKLEELRSSLLRDIYIGILIAIPVISLLVPLFQKLFGVH